MSVIDLHLTRAAIFTPSTWNAESQTIEAVASTFADVPRRDSKGLYLERLDPAGLDPIGAAAFPPAPPCSAIVRMLLAA